MFEQFEIEDNLIIGNRNSKEMKVEGMVSKVYLTNERKKTTTMSIQESATIKQEIAIQVQ